MSDIVERLRAIADDTAGLTEEAADEIERLRADNARLNELFSLKWDASQSEETNRLKAEIERLRSTLELQGTAVREYQEIIAELRASASELPAPQHPPASA